MSYRVSGRRCGDFSLELGYRGLRNGKEGSRLALCVMGALGQQRGLFYLSLSSESLIRLVWGTGWYKNSNSFHHSIAFPLPRKRRSSSSTWTRETQTARCSLGWSRRSWSRVVSVRFWVVNRRMPLGWKIRRSGR